MTSPTYFTQWMRVNNKLPQHLTDYLTTLPQSTPSWPYVLRSPGRINLIGEHTDYTGGLVLPASIDKAIYFAASPLDRPVWRLHAVDIGQTYTLPLPISGRTGQLWVDYLAGIGTQFQDQGHLLPGLEIVFGGDLPSGAGVSSSAALEGGTAFLLNHLLNAGLDRPALAQLCKRSSNTFLGIPSGIMDQFASLNGLASGPILLNCHTLAHEPVKDTLTDYGLLLVNSMVSHDLSDGAYADRVASCTRILETLQTAFPGLTHLSAATMEQLRVVQDQVEQTDYRRAAYVVQENERVRQAITALEAGNAHALGQLLNTTHEGLRDDYEVSCEELDFLQQEANQLGGVAGARLMGGGFGGCTLNLVRADAIDRIATELRQRYRQAFGINCETYPVRLAAGTDFV